MYRRVLNLSKISSAACLIKPFFLAFTSARTVSIKVVVLDETIPLPALKSEIDLYQSISLVRRKTQMASRHWRSCFHGKSSSRPCPSSLEMNRYSWSVPAVPALHAPVVRRNCRFQSPVPFQPGYTFLRFALNHVPDCTFIPRQCIFAFKRHSSRPTPVFSSITYFV